MVDLIYSVFAGLLVIAFAIMFPQLMIGIREFIDFSIKSWKELDRLGHDEKVRTGKDIVKLYSVQFEGLGLMYIAMLSSFVPYVGSIVCLAVGFLFDVEALVIAGMVALLTSLFLCVVFLATSFNSFWIEMRRMARSVRVFWCVEEEDEGGK